MSDEKICVNVKIFGNDYSFSGYETREHITKVCYYVDKKIKEISDTNPGISHFDLAVMAGVNISDEYHKLLDNESETKKDIATFNGVIDDLGSKITILEKENDYLRQVIDSLKERIDEYEKK